MPDYTIVCDFNDEVNGHTTRQWTGTFADDAAADTAATDLLTDLNAATNALITPTLKKHMSAAGAVVANARVFENARITLQKNDSEEYPLDLPAPVAAVFNTGTNQVNTTATVVTDLIANFSATGWKISDGEYPVAVLRGKRVFLRSGKTNLK